MQTVVDPAVIWTYENKTGERETETERDKQTEKKC